MGFLFGRVVEHEFVPDAVAVDDFQPCGSAGFDIDARRREAHGGSLDHDSACDVAGFVRIIEPQAPGRIGNGFLRRHRGACALRASEDMRAHHGMLGEQERLHLGPAQ
jgi:hypothetical protein